jgi:DNA-binding MurR/RpiR family transcriptional regulator
VTDYNKEFIKNEINLMERIKLKYSRLSKSQKMIANYILDHYDKAAFMTASLLGETVDVSESTVVRFANALGYSGYPKLQKALQELIKTKLTTVQRLELSNNQITQDSIIRDVIKSDIENIQATLNELDREEFSKIVEILHKAKNIYIVGFRTTTVLTEFLGFYLNLILDNVRVVSYGISDIYEQLINVTSDDVVIGISFPRYSRKTAQILEFVKEKGSQVIAITDSDLSPLIELSDYKLIARSNMVSFVDSLVVPLSLMNALIVSLGMGEREKITKTFEDLEKIWERYEIYTSKDRMGKI